ncbi:hypothetical protein IAR50_002322 [Cryptococcus sp. DSM 104548]
MAQSIVQKAKSEVLAAQISGLDSKDEDGGRDLISLLLKANMAAQLKAEERLSDKEVMNLVTTFMTQGPETQTHLREEVMAVLDERPSLDTLNSLRYMDLFTGQDIAIPLGIPVIGRDKKVMTSIDVKKGTAIFARQYFRRELKANEY